MSREYAMSRVGDALSSCDGNMAQAQRLIMGWLEKDQTLLLGLVAPHIKGIVTHAVTHAVARTQEPKKKIEVAPEDISDFGEELLANALGRGGKGNENYYNVPMSGSPGGRPVKASSAHVSAMQMLASKSGKGTDTTGKKKK